MRIEGERNASTRRDASRPPQIKHTGIAKPTTSFTARATDPTEGITRKGKPHEPRETEAKQPRPATPAATPSPAGYRGGKQADG